MRLGRNLRLAVVSLMLTGCQSHDYHIKGEAHWLQDGDTIIVADENGHELGRSLVNGGTFSLTGSTSTATMCQLFASAEPDNRLWLFLEGGLIYVELHQEEGESRVSGTKVNNEWQLLADSIKLLGNEAVGLAQQSIGSDSSRQRDITLRLQQLKLQMEEAVERAARRNSDNPLGRYIRDNYRADKN